MKISKKILSIILAIMMVISIVPITASAATSGTCGEGLTWNYDEETQTLTISGTGVMTDYSAHNSPWATYEDNIIAIIISDGVTSIGNNAFSSSSNLTNIKIPDSITSIGESAFNGCTSLTNMEIPASVTSIGFCAFYYCLNLTNISVESENQYYSSGEYGELFNKDKTTLIQCSVNNTGSSYTIPNGVITIYPYAFINWTNLTSIIIPNSVTTIVYSAFSGCASLKSITFPNSVTTIEDYAFYNCVGLTDIHYSSTKEQWNNIVIGSYNDCLTNAIIHYNSSGLDSNSTDTEIFFGADENSFGEDITGYVGDEVEATLIYKNSENNISSLDISSGDTNVVEIEAIRIGSGDYNNEVERDAYIMLKLKSAGTATIIITSPEGITESVNVLVKEVCSMCGGKTVVIDAGVPATCTATGITEGKHCSVCNEVLVAQTEVAALGHTEEVVAGYAATCTETGLTEGRHCSVCNEVLVAQTVVDALGHSYESFVTASTCTAAGYTTYTCSACGDTYTADEVAATGHNMVETAAEVAPTYTADGKTAVYTCANGCGKTEGGEVVHNIVNGVCSVCGETESGTDKKYYIVGKEFDNNLDYYAEDCNSSSYNPTLANMMAALSVAVYSETDIVKAQESLGFTYYDVFEYDSAYNPHTCGYSLAFKESDFSDDMICLVSVRGSQSLDYNADWIGNFEILTDSDGKHVGFSYPANNIYQEIQNYISVNNITKNVKFFITGHSRGATVANLLAVKLMENGINSANVYNYNFACPDVACKYVFTNYNNIFNLCNRTDIVPLVPGPICSGLTSPGTSWGKYGQTYWFTKEAENSDNVFDNHDYNLYLEFFDQRLNPSDWPYDATDKEWDNSHWLLGWITKIFCPVDVIITDENGGNIASVINGEINYYNSSFGDVIILTDGDKKIIYINGENDFNVNLIGTDNGTMTYSIEKGNFVTGEIYESKTFSDVALEDGKTMYSPVSEAKETDDVQLLVAEEKNGEKIYTHIINEDGTEEIFYDLSIQTPSRTEIRNKDGIVLHANVEGTAPAGSYVVWTSSNGNFDEDADGNNLTVIAEDKGYTTFTATLYDAGENVLATDSVELYSKSGFFDKIGGFFRFLFGTTKIYEN